MAHADVEIDVESPVGSDEHAHVGDEDSYGCESRHGWEDIDGKPPT